MMSYIFPYLLTFIILVVSSPSDASESLNDNVIEVKEIKENPVPTDKVVTTENQYVTIYLPEKYEHFQNSTCILVHEDTAKQYNLTAVGEKNEGIERYFGGCGVRMLAKRHRAGSWSIYQFYNLSTFSSNELSTYHEPSVRKSEFTVIIRDQIKSNSRTKINELWNLGFDITFPFTPYNSDHWCDLTRPDGSVIILSSPCKFIVHDVNPDDAGVWTVHYSLKHSMERIEEKIIVEVQDPQEVAVSVSKTGQSIHMLCKANMKIHLCLFERPDGRVIVAPVALGNDKYEYFGSGNKNLLIGGKAECGLTIREPSEKDFGMWKCSMRNHREPRRAFVYVGPDNKTLEQITLPVSHENVQVKIGNDFQIKCLIDARLDYCWIRSPSGMHHSVTKKLKSPNNLLYTGKGLKNGDCTATIFNSSNEHSGNWTCHLGVHDSSEVQAKVHVEVSGFSMIAEVTENGIFRRQSSTLQCRTFPNTKVTIDYCRWIRPDGKGIYKKNSNKYTISIRNNTCSLQVNSWSKEEEGKWTCFAGSSIKNDEELFAVIELEKKLGRPLTFPSG